MSEEHSANLPEDYRPQLPPAEAAAPEGQGDLNSEAVEAPKLAGQPNGKSENASEYYE